MEKVKIKKKIGNVTFENCRLMFRNFQGKAGQYNPEGNRNFAVALDDPEMITKLTNDGWNVKRLKPNEDNPEGQAYLPVKVKYNNYPPIAEMIVDNKKTKLDENTIGQLDWSIITNCDLIVRPYEYPEMNGRPAGISAYMKSIYVTVEVDDLAKKYNNMSYADETPNDENEDIPF